MEVPRRLTGRAAAGAARHRVELTPKSRAHLAEVFATLPGNTVAVTYFAPAADLAALRVALAEVLADRRTPLAVQAVELPRCRGSSMRGSGEAELRDPGRAPAPPPRVVTVLGSTACSGWSACPPCRWPWPPRRCCAWPRVRPWLVAAVAAVALAGSWPPGGRRCSAATCSASTSGWAMFSLTHPHVDVAFWRMVFEAPVGLPSGCCSGRRMLHSDHATRGLPWHPRTIQRTAASNARAGRQVARTLERMPPFVG